MTNPIDNDDDFSLFQQEVGGIKKLTQDTIIQAPKKTLAQKDVQRTFHETQDNEFYFSDEYEPVFVDGKVRYRRDDVSSHEAKRLRRGDYKPELFLDLHGMTQVQAKRELAALITYCMKENVCCASVMHGFGKNILKQKVPAWLAQHPNILAFEQAPQAHGGQAAILVLFHVLEN